VRHDSIINVCSALQCVALCCQCVAMCCSVSRCVAVCCRALKDLLHVVVHFKILEPSSTNDCVLEETSIGET